MFLNLCELNFSWFIAGLAAVATNASLFENVCAPEQSFKDGEYCGIFKFRFFLPEEGKEGDWVLFVFLRVLLTKPFTCISILYFPDIFFNNWF